MEKPSGLRDVLPIITKPRRFGVLPALYRHRRETSLVTCYIKVAVHGSRDGLLPKEVAKVHELKTVCRAVQSNRLEKGEPFAKPDH